MKVFYWLMMHYCDYKLDNSMTYEKRLYWFVRFMNYKTKLEGGYYVG